MLRKQSHTRRLAEAGRFEPPQAADTGRELFTTVRGKSRGPVILVVDEDPLRRWALYAVLGDAGFRVLPVMDGNHAERLVEETAERLCLALIDEASWMLTPDLGGFLRRRWPGLPIVVALDVEDAGLERFIREQGADEVLNRPFGPDDIVHLANRLTGRRPDDVAISTHDTRAN